MGIRLSRRAWLASLGAVTAAGSSRVAARDDVPVAGEPTGQGTGQQAGGDLLLKDFQPRSMLVVPETPVPRARYPVVDVHTHPTFRSQSKGGIPMGEAVAGRTSPADLIAAMDRRNIRTLVNLTGGVGSGLAETVRGFDQAHRGRFVTYTEPTYERSAEPGYPQWQADELARAKQAGARGLKILKVLGLYLREQITDGRLVTVDDRRFDPMWDACGTLGLPVSIHVSDPVAFFLPIDRYNERYEELSRRPEWSFHGRDFPSDAELLAARDRVLARHPKTMFIGLHVGHAPENLASAAATMDRFPNFHVEIAARIGELGRQPRSSQRFFDKYQDRIMFGTDGFRDELYPIYFRFLETEDEYFEYSPGPVPSQGRWRIYGLGLSDQVLRKVYYENADRLLGTAS
jgi:predicted TIM-barrel fold metal-dependent hydrolase